MSAVDLFDRLSAEKLRGELDPDVIGREIIVLEKTTSTNDAILRLAPRGATEGLVVFAEHQTTGRGQRGNRWESPPRQGLCFSILLHPGIELAESARLTAWAAQTVARTIEKELSLPASIKPPNDIHVMEGKVGGVLVEMRAQKNAKHFAVVGIGINVNQSLSDFPEDLRNRAISLAMALGRPVDRQRFAVALLRNLDRTYPEVLS